MGQSRGARRQRARQRKLARTSNSTGSFHAARLLAATQDQDWASQTPHWPPGIVSSSQRSPFNSHHLELNEEAPSCEPVRFPAGPDRSSVILGLNRSHQELRQGHAGKLAMRSVVWSARMGLGNSIRGLVNTFLFALLSGRQLLVSPGGQYGSSIETLFQGFQGHLDWTDRSVPHVPMYDFRHPNFLDGRPVLQGNPSIWHLGIWYADHRTRACVLQSLQCSSVWCVHSRILQLFMGSPKASLGESIAEALVVAPMLELPPSQDPGLDSNSAQNPDLKGGTALASSEGQSLGAPAEGQESGGIAGGHTLDASAAAPAPAAGGGVEGGVAGGREGGVVGGTEKGEDKTWGVKAGVEDRLGMEVDKEGQEGEGREGGEGRGEEGLGNRRGLRATSGESASDTSSFDRASKGLLSPIGKLLLWLRRRGDTPKTIGEGREATTGRRRGGEGSAGKRKGEGGGEGAGEAGSGLTKWGERERRRELFQVEVPDGVGSGEARHALRLKFDVAIHVRTYHKCVESYNDIPECHAAGVPHAFEALKLFPELRPFVEIHRWSCISSLLRFLLRLKAKRRQELGADFQGLFRSPKDSEHLQKYLRKAAHQPGRRPVAPEAPPEEGATEGEWTLEDATAMAGTGSNGLGIEEVEGEGENGREAGGGVEGEGSAQGLAIFLATDNEALRPLFVEYLRPFGAVGFSNSSVMHLAHANSALPLHLKLVTLGEFYLLSRSSVLVSFNQKNSSYAEMASLYGNTTLLRGVGKLTCNFPAQHIAVPVPGA